MSTKVKNWKTDKMVQAEMAKALAKSWKREKREAA